LCCLFSKEGFHPLDRCLKDLFVGKEKLFEGRRQNATPASATAFLHLLFVAKNAVTVSLVCLNSGWLAWLLGAKQAGQSIKSTAAFVRVRGSPAWSLEHGRPFDHWSCTAGWHRGGWLWLWVVCSWLRRRAVLGCWLFASEAPQCLDWLGNLFLIAGLLFSFVF